MMRHRTRHFLPQYGVGEETTAYECEYMDGVRRVVDTHVGNSIYQTYTRRLPLVVPTLDPRRARSRDCQHWRDAGDGDGGADAAARCARPSIRSSRRMSGVALSRRHRLGSITTDAVEPRADDHARRCGARSASPPDVDVVGQPVEALPGLEPLRAARCRRSRMRRAVDIRQCVIPRTGGGCSASAICARRRTAACSASARRCRTSPWKPPSTPRSARSTRRARRARRRSRRSRRSPG